MIIFIYMTANDSMRVFKKWTNYDRVRLHVSITAMVFLKSLLAWRFLLPVPVDLPSSLTIVRLCQLSITGNLPVLPIVHREQSPGAANLPLLPIAGRCRSSVAVDRLLLPIVQCDVGHSNLFIDGQRLRGRLF